MFTNSLNGLEKIIINSRNGLENFFKISKDITASMALKIFHVVLLIDVLLATGEWNK